MDITFCEKNEALGKKRRLHFFLVDETDGKTPETGEAGGQPQISIDGAAWTDSGVAALVHIGNGHYYAELSQATVNVDHAIILGRYKSAATVESPARHAIEVGGYRNGTARWANECVVDNSPTGATVVYNHGGYDGGAGTVIMTITPTQIGGTSKVRQAIS